MTAISTSEHYRPFCFPKTLWPVEWATQESIYLFEQVIDGICPNSVQVFLENGKHLLMFSSYSYLGLLQHQAISAAVTAAVEMFGSGTDILARSIYRTPRNLTISLAEMR